MDTWFTPELQSFLIPYSLKLLVCRNREHSILWTVCTRISLIWRKTALHILFWRLLMCLFGLDAIILKEPNVKDHLSCMRGEEDLVVWEGREDKEWGGSAGPLKDCDQSLPYDPQILGSFYVSLKAIQHFFISEINHPMPHGPKTLSKK